jgi:hypothetical protein
MNDVLILSANQTKIKLKPTLFSMTSNKRFQIDINQLPK